ncbi:peptide deformylase [Candidatus Mesenet endosymbiont of Phosphuga atrata]|uniref:peptide deformylase n=1 Tax=Candidatus Mesenet endosymbiont of Phosphuga atrata TaxID=3066221 RepID=UPI0030D3BDFD
MSILPIIIAPDDRLHLCSEEVMEVNDEVKRLVDDMFETMYHEGGLGLAAVQIGVHKRIFIADVPEEYDNLENRVDGYSSTGGPFCIINPQIIELSDESILLNEGCLSVPEQRNEISRPKYLTLKYLDYYGKKQIVKAQGWLARCFQHEVDHLNGILYFKYLSKIKYDMAVKKAQKIKRYYKQ